MGEERNRSDLSDKRKHMRLLAIELDSTAMHFNSEHSQVAIAYLIPLYAAMLLIWQLVSRWIR